jgi:hypothetical protein
VSYLINRNLEQKVTELKCVVLATFSTISKYAELLIFTTGSLKYVKKNPI